MCALRNNLKEERAEIQSAVAADGVGVPTSGSQHGDRE